MRAHRWGHRGRVDWPAMAMLFGARRGWGRAFSDEDGDWGGPRRRGRGPGGRGRVFAGGELRLVLLALIAETPRHGYELIKAIEELSGGNYSPSPGVVYPTLNLLADEGAIEEAAGDGSRKAYAATDTGRTELDERSEEFQSLIDRLKALAEDEERHRAPPIRRAVGNLFAALRDRAADGDFDRDTVHRIAEILDEAARKIERL